MKALFFSSSLLFFLFSCKKTEQNIAKEEVVISQNVHFKEDNNTLNLTSGKFNIALKKSLFPLKKVIFLNSSLIGYMTELGLEDKIIGVSNPEYIYSDKIHQLIKAGKIQNVGSEQKYDVEKIISLKPDAVLTNYIASFENTYELLKKNGITIIFLDEYLEQKPLEKSAYLKLYGKLFGIEKKSDSLYTVIEKNYNQLKAEALRSKDKPEVICNEMYGNQWFVPGGNSFVAQYFKDANASYPWVSLPNENSVPLSFEEVFAKSSRATYWVNVGEYKKKSELLAFNPVYAKLHPFKNGKVYSLYGSVKGKSNDYFASGVVRADKVLHDYINIFHPHLLKDSALVYMKELK
ncbi:ABC transporter substrate-binding protein [Elizabethkingia meningoseptica]|uniref:ABC transporter substrate-binding protein n=1 Tax=Elizabethkingia meningoseptica TaxID=238 RepID=UPI00201113D2|nr:ABC transporter substrate-binding protein [Elizabethkingia meningoseptica]MCL1674551.1 ABC transporter substrate-binding protein [Elizabethkingia meningoseptica]MCL1686250.1 ABC transporter substrate-binding protein [Elizabethkingia meningoseptica]